MLKKISLNNASYSRSFSSRRAWQRWVFRRNDKNVYCYPTFTSFAPQNTPLLNAGAESIPEIDNVVGGHSQTFLHTGKLSSNMI
jgi:hypothetical protein